MESDLTVSYEKLIVDDEILGMRQRVLRGIEANDETLATDLMIEKGSGQDFLAERHTQRFMRSEFFTPSLASRESRDVYDPEEHGLLARRGSTAPSALGRGSTPVGSRLPRRSR